MATTTDYVGTVQDQVLENIRLTQEAVVDGFEAWTQAVDSLMPDLSSWSSSGRSVPNAEQVIDETFEFAARLIEAQRDFAKSIVGVGRETGDVTSPTSPPAKAKTTSPAESGSKGEGAASPTTTEAKPKTTSLAASGPKGDSVAPSATKEAKPKTTSPAAPGSKGYSAEPPTTTEAKTASPAASDSKGVAPSPTKEAKPKSGSTRTRSKS